MHNSRTAGPADILLVAIFPGADASTQSPCEAKLAAPFHDRDDTRRTRPHRQDEKRASVMVSIGKLSLAQKDGCPPAMMGGSAPGESGVSVFKLQFRDGLYFSATPHQHLIWFQLTEVHIECRRSGRIIEQDVPAGSLAICPAGPDCGAEADDSVDALLVTIEPGRFSVAAADDASLDAQLIERLSGQDHALLGLARTLALESAGDYPNGPLFW